MDNPVLDISFWLLAASIVGLLAVSAFFSVSETALTAASRNKLRALADRNVRGAMTALNITEDTERMIGALLLGRTLVIILSASLATMLLANLSGDGGVVLTTLGLTALVLMFAEVLPKTYATTNPEGVAVRVAPVINLLTGLLAPIVSAIRTVVRGILRVFGVRADPDGKILALREDIMGAITLGHSEGAVEKEARDRLLGALDLSTRTVEEVMRHRSRIEMIDADTPPDEILRQALASPHSRLPIYRGGEENILGVVHAKDLLREVNRLVQLDPIGENRLAGLDIVKVAMKPYFVPETTTLDEQMRQFLKRHTHFALVVDEYGGLQGLITLEDIIEEIVGEITDEFDVVEKEGILKPTDTGAYLVEGAMTIRDVNRAMDWSLPDDEANTIAGLVIHEAQMIPNQGQVFLFHGFRFEVLEKRENRVTKLKMRPL